MKTKITRVTIVDNDGKRTSLKPNKIVDNIEEYRKSLKDKLEAKMVLFDMEEIECESEETK